MVGKTSFPSAATFVVGLIWGFAAREMGGRCLFFGSGYLWGRRLCSNEENNAWMFDDDKHCNLVHAIKKLSADTAHTSKLIAHGSNMETLWMT